MRRRIAVLLPVAAAAALVAFLLRRLKGSDSSSVPEAAAVASRQPRPDAGAPPSDEAATETVEHTYACEECGTEYRVSGEGRHTVYWKADASISDPVIDGRCVQCERPLPGHHPTEADEDPAAADPEASAAEAPAVDAEAPSGDAAPDGSASPSADAAPEGDGSPPEDALQNEPPAVDGSEEDAVAAPDRPSESA